MEKQKIAKYLFLFFERKQKASFKERLLKTMC